MLTMDIFNQDAFHMIKLTETLNYQNYFPSFLRSSGLFTEEGVEVHDISLEEREGSMDLVQTSPRYSPPSQTTHEERRIRKFSSVRLSREAHVNAGEVQGIREFGTTSSLESLTSKVNQRTLKVQREIDATIENMMLGAIQGVVLDADGSQLWDWYDELGVTKLPDVNFDFTNAAEDGRFATLCRQLSRSMQRVVNGMLLSRDFGIEALCGDDFWDAFIAHPEIRETYKGYSDAASLRNERKPYGEFEFHGIRFINYMGSHNAQGVDDASEIAAGRTPATKTVGIAPTECRLYPRGVEGLFKIYYTPADVWDFVNTPGLPSYVLPKVETMHQYSKSAVWEVQSNPLVLCKRPRCLVRGVAS